MIQHNGRFRDKMPVSFLSHAPCFPRIVPITQIDLTKFWSIEPLVHARLESQCSFESLHYFTIADDTR